MVGVARQTPACRPVLCLAGLRVWAAALCVVVAAAHERGVEQVLPLPGGLAFGKSMGSLARSEPKRARATDFCLLPRLQSQWASTGLAGAPRAQSQRL